MTSLCFHPDGEWKSTKILPYKNLEFPPAASVFHYGQAIFEGLKAHKNEAGEVFIFRAEENLKRLNRSAERMCMPIIPKEIFLGGLRQLVELEKEWIPVGSGKSLYLRPFMIADDPFLGVKPSTSYKFIIIASPSATYYTPRATFPPHLSPRPVCKCTSASAWNTRHGVPCERPRRPIVSKGWCSSSRAPWV